MTDTEETRPLNVRVEVAIHADMVVLPADVPGGPVIAPAEAHVSVWGPFSPALAVDVALTAAQKTAIAMRAL